MVLEPFSYSDREFEFLAPGRIAGNVTAEQINSVEFSPGMLGVTRIILTPNHASLLNILQKRFHGGTSLDYPGNSPGEIAFYVFTIPSHQ